MASIRDVAQRAGVGVGTVSRVLNGNGYVAEETRKKIETAISELEYTPMSWPAICSVIRRGLTEVWFLTGVIPSFLFL